MNYCAFCARSKNIESNAICKCAHCPRVFHTDCMEGKGINKGTGMFICPHHKCASCTRSTAAAGGLLFRCMGCLTSYCEDCLPQDEIESIGRCRDMEELGYDSKQSYYILCPSCCIHDGVTAKGVVGDQVVDDGEEADDEDDDEEDEEDEAPTPTVSHNGRNGQASSSASRIKEESSLLPSQLMRVVWDEEPDSEEERQEKLRISREAKKAEKERIKLEEKKRKKEEMAAAERKRLLKEKEKEKTKGKNKVKDVKMKGKLVAVVAKKGRKSQPVEESSEEKEEVPQKRGRASLKGYYHLCYQCLLTT
jgi:hypothetical protein